MRIEFKYTRGKNPLVLVFFEADSNFNPDDMSWSPRLSKVKRIYDALKKAGAWDQTKKVVLVGVALTLISLSSVRRFTTVEQCTNKVY